MRHFILWILVIVILIAASCFSAITHNCTWISRSGTFIIVLGIVVESWELLKTRRVDSLRFWTTQEGNNSLRNAIRLIIFGTFVAGFGDLICKLF